MIKSQFRAAGVLLLLAACYGENSLAGWILDDVTILEPRLSAELIWEASVESSGVCSTSTELFDDVREVDCGPSFSAAAWIGFDILGGQFGIFREPGGRFAIHKRTSGTMDSIPQLRIGVEGSRRDIDIRHVLLDQANGNILITFFSFCRAGGLNCTEGVELAGIVRVTGLPTISDVAPEGPPGPPGPGGPPGPSGMDADESRVLSLESLVAAQQTTIQSQQAGLDALRSALEQIEQLPTIQRLLEKVEELEQSSP